MEEVANCENLSPRDGVSATSSTPSSRPRRASTTPSTPREGTPRKQQQPLPPLQNEYLQTIAQKLKDGIDSMKQDWRKRSMTMVGKLDLAAQLQYAGELLERRDDEILKAVELGQELVERIKDLMSEKESLQQKLSERRTAHEKQIKDLQSEIQFHIEANEKIKTDKNELQTQVQAMQADFLRMQEEVRQLREEQASNSARLVSLSRINRQLMDELELYKTQQQRTTEIIIDDALDIDAPTRNRRPRHERVVSGLNWEIGRLVNEINANKINMQSGQKAQSEVKELREENRALRRELEEYKSLKHENHELKQQSESLMAALETARARCNELAGELKKLQEALLLSQGSQSHIGMELKGSMLTELERSLEDQLEARDRLLGKTIQLYSQLKTAARSPSDTADATIWDLSQNISELIDGEDEAFLLADGPTKQSLENRREALQRKNLGIDMVVNRAILELESDGIGESLRDCVLDAAYLYKCLNSRSWEISKLQAALKLVRSSPYVVPQDSGNRYQQQQQQQELVSDMCLASSNDTALHVRSMQGTPEFIPMEHQQQKFEETSIGNGINTNNISVPTENQNLPTEQDERILESLRQHKIPYEEVEAFVHWISMAIASLPTGNDDDEDWRKRNLPIIPAIRYFTIVRDGILLCKLINYCIPGTIDERALNIKREGNASLSDQEMRENLNLALQSAASIGCHINDDNDDIPTLILQGQACHIIMDLTYNIIRTGLHSHLNAHNYPAIMQIIGADNSPNTRGHKRLSSRIPNKQVLQLWVNHIMKQTRQQSSPRVDNCDHDVRNLSVIATIAAHVAGATLESLLSAEMDALKRAQMVLDITRNKLSSSSPVGWNFVPSAVALTIGCKRVNELFVASLFFAAMDQQQRQQCAADTSHLLNAPIIHNPNSKTPAPCQTTIITAVMPNNDDGTREERTFRNWIQSMGFECTDLVEDNIDGLLLLKVLSKLKPGCVDWRKVNMKPTNDFERVENCNVVLSCITNTLGIPLVNISGKDLLEGNRKLVLSICWQIMRWNIFDMLGKLKMMQGRHQINEQYLVNWANENVMRAATTRPAVVPSNPISGFKDPSLRTSLFLINLLHSIAPHAVNYSLVANGDTDAECESNAKYAISVARKLGATIFTLYEDIVEVKPRMLLTFVASIMSVHGATPK